MAKSVADITGQTFNYLTVIGFGHKNRKKNVLRTYLRCRCKCGNITFGCRSDIINNKKKSCGCYPRFRKHGFVGTKFYRVWASMNERCRNKKCKTYPNYGGRGIKICSRWRNFINFKKDMYKNYLYHVRKYGREQTSIERIDNNLGYSKLNCKWATQKEQSFNKRNNRYITIKTETKTLTEWANIFNMKLPSLHSKLKTCGKKFSKVRLRGGQNITCRAAQRVS